MNLQFADNTSLILVGAREVTEYINNQRRAAISLAFDGSKYQDAKLREVFIDQEKIRTMQIDNGTPIKGYTVFVRSIYEFGQISIVMAQDVPAVEAQLVKQNKMQAQAIDIMIGDTPSDSLIAEAKAKRAQIEAAAADLSDEQAYERAWMFPLWDGGGHAYAEGERVQHGGVLYRCLTGHTSQDSWRPDTAPSLWVRMDDPAVEWPEWRQPAGSTDAYSKGNTGLAT